MNKVIEPALLRELKELSATHTAPTSYRRKPLIIGLNWQILIKRRKQVNKLQHLEDCLSQCDICIERWHDQYLGQTCEICLEHIPTKGK